METISHQQWIEETIRLNTTTTKYWRKKKTEEWRGMEKCIMNQDMHTHRAQKSREWMEKYTTVQSYQKIGIVLKKAYRWNYADSPNHANQKRLRGNRERLKPRDLVETDAQHTHTNPHCTLVWCMKRSNTSCIYHFQKYQMKALPNPVAVFMFMFVCISAALQAHSLAHGIFSSSNINGMAVGSLLFHCECVYLQNVLHQQFLLIVYLHSSIAWFVVTAQTFAIHFVVHFPR